MVYTLSMKKYLTSNDISKIWKISERSVRDYCSKGRVIGAYLEGKTWMIPNNASKPKRQIRHSNKKRNLLETLRLEKESQIKGGIYHKLQIEMTYNSNHMEGSKLTHDETRYIYETKTIGPSFPLQLELKIGLPRANPRGSLKFLSFSRIPKQLEKNDVVPTSS